MEAFADPGPVKDKGRAPGTPIFKGGRQEVKDGGHVLRREQALGIVAISTQTAAPPPRDPCCLGADSPRGKLVRQCVTVRAEPACVGGGTGHQWLRAPCRVGERLYWEAALGGRQCGPVEHPSSNLGGKVGSSSRLHVRYRKDASHCQIKSGHVWA